MNLPAWFKWLCTSIAVASGLLTLLACIQLFINLVAGELFQNTTKASRNFLWFMSWIPLPSNETTLFFVNILAALVFIVSLFLLVKKSPNPPSIPHEPIQPVEAPVAVHADEVIAPDPPPYSLDFKSDKWLNDWKPTLADLLESEVTTGTPESPKGKAVRIRILGDNSLIHEIQRPLPIKRIVFDMICNRDVRLYAKFISSAPGKPPRSDQTILAFPDCSPRDGLKPTPNEHWCFPEKEHIGTAGWCRFEIDVDKEFAKSSFGNQGYKADSLREIRLRGHFEVSSIRLYGPKVLSPV